MGFGDIDGRIKESDSYVTLTNAYLQESSRITYLIQKSSGSYSKDGTVQDWDLTDLLANEVDVISSYTISGGPEQPFESVNMKLSRKKLMMYVSDLDKADSIIAGRNRLEIHGIGHGTYVVTKCKLSNNTYSITAYCDAEVYRGGVLVEPISGTALNIILNILKGTSHDYGKSFAPADIITNCPDSANNPTESYSFTQGKNVWTVLQLCAMYLNAKLFFANNKAYLIDYTRLDQYYGVYFEDTFSSNQVNPDRLFELYSDDAKSPFNGAVSGNISLGSEGIDTVLNSITITYRTADGKTGKATPTSSNQVICEKSIALYGPSEFNMDISEYLVESGGKQEKFAQNLVDFVVKYRAEPQQSISFTVKERSIGNGGDIYWSPMFPIVTAVSGFSSAMDDIKISSKSSINGNSVQPQRMALSSYTRHYPEGTTTYDFGIANNVDLSQSTSQIMSRIS